MHAENDGIITMEVASNGGISMIRREADSETAGTDIALTYNEPADITLNGSVKVVAAAQTESEMVTLEELTAECMYDEPTAECIEKFGSYGVRKLHTENSDNIVKLKLHRPEWMAHPEVQKRRLFDLSLPGSYNAGTYVIAGEDAAVESVQEFGLVSQNMDIYEQLQLGVRVLHFRVAYSAENSLVYISHGALMMALEVAMKDVRRFLEEHEREVVVLDISKDDNAASAHLEPLVEEETTNTRVPGQLVHEVVQGELKEMLATYPVLAKLPGNAIAENPTVGALTDIGARVIYFWDTQQVLCTNFTSCKSTPGWYPANRGKDYPFAFGPPLKLGTRTNVTNGRIVRMIEPSCLVRSNTFTKDNSPEKLLKKIKTYAKDMRSKTEESRPKCFPEEVELPEEHRPTLWYSVDGYITPTPEEQSLQNDRMRGVKAIYTRGEGFTSHTDAERTNYLLLSWFFKQRGQAISMRPNAIMFEFAGSAYMAIIRMIEAQQGRPDCGWAIYCKASGSCWANTLLDAWDNCRQEEDVVKILKEHAGEDEGMNVKVYYANIIGVIALICLGVSSFGAYIVTVMFPTKPKEKEKKKEIEEEFVYHEGEEGAGEMVESAEKVAGYDDKEAYY